MNLMTDPFKVQEL